MGPPVHYVCYRLFVFSNVQLFNLYQVTRLPQAPCQSQPLFVKHHPKSLKTDLFKTFYQVCMWPQAGRSQAISCKPGWSCLATKRSASRRPFERAEKTITDFCIRFSCLLFVCFRFICYLFLICILFGRLLRTLYFVC